MSHDARTTMFNTHSRNSARRVRRVELGERLHVLERLVVYPIQNKHRQHIYPSDDIQPAADNTRSVGRILVAVLKQVFDL